jgi:hypothetical protein
MLKGAVAGALYLVGGGIGIAQDASTRDYPTKPVRLKWVPVIKTAGAIED